MANLKTEQDFINYFKSQGMSDQDIQSLKSGSHPLLGQGANQKMPVINNNGFPMKTSTYGESNTPQGFEGRPNTGMQNQAPQPQTAQQPQDNQVAELLKKLQPTAGQSIANAMSVLGGGKPVYDPDLGREALKSAGMMKMMTPNYVTTYDAQGNPIYNQAPMGHIVQQPSAMTPLGIERTQAEIESRRAGIPLKQSQAELASQQAQLIGQISNKNENNGGFDSGDMPPGTTLKAGGLNIPINRELNQEEMSAVSGVAALDPIVKDIESMIQQGYMDSKLKNIPVLGDLDRTARQKISDSTNALLSSKDENLQAFQSKLNALRKTLPFTEGGKALSDTEKELVFALLNTTGKSNNQVIIDLNNAMQILRNKETLALGGTNSVGRLKEDNRQRQAELQNNNVAKQQNINQSYKTGESRNINGVIHIRQEDGTWLPQS